MPDLKSLSMPSKDADAMKEFLEANDYEVKVLKSQEANKLDIKKEI